PRNTDQILQSSAKWGAPCVRSCSSYFLASTREENCRSRSCNQGNAPASANVRARFAACMKNFSVFGQGKVGVVKISRRKVAKSQACFKFSKSSFELPLLLLFLIRFQEFAAGFGRFFISKIIFCAFYSRSSEDVLFFPQTFPRQERML